ncbi:exopolysaccharide Pel transporter PelG, partial [candidate division KSB1 bacterium]|nr:exopolysaccharide Pel transporter PelG [candidate division KSB1 bacterium]
MAGIGFHLRKLFKPDTFIDNFRAVIYSGTIASGPIFFSIICLALLGFFAKSQMQPQQFDVFTVTVVYIFAFSLIATGTTQLVLSRYLSDLIYEKNYHAIAPALSTALVFTIFIQAIFGLPLLFALHAEVFYRLTAFGLFIIVGCIWQLMVFLSAVKNFNSIVWAFFIGVLLSFILGYVLAQNAGLSGLMHGYALGQFTIFLVLLWRVVGEFNSPLRPAFAFFSFMKKLPALLFIGLFYNLGIWIDKILFWYSDVGENIDAFLYASSLYDNAMYLAYMTIIPSYTYFLVKVETSFYSYFRSFFQTILKKDALQLIEEKKEAIADSVRESLLGLIKVQGLVTVLCLFYSDEILVALNMSHLSILIFEKALVALFLQMLVLTLMIFMMYFDIRKELLVVSGLFVFSNAILSFLSLQMGIAFYGYGYLFANFITLSAAYWYLNEHLKNLE